MRALLFVASVAALQRTPTGLPAGRSRGLQQPRVSTLQALPNPFRSGVLGSARTPLEDEACTVDDSGLSLKELLRRYGVVALLFHFTVWISTMSMGYAALSVGDPATLITHLPVVIREALPVDVVDPEGAAAAAGGLALLKLQVSLAICEVVGPARLALTVAATPAVSGALRQSDAFCQFEKTINAKLEKVPFLATDDDDAG